MPCNTIWSEIEQLSATHITRYDLLTSILCSPKTGGNATFPNILNNFVHVCMYFYYMVSAMGPQYQKYLWWKKYMTELQIVSIQDMYE